MQIQTGDYLMIQFGHNDSATGEIYEVERSVKLGAPDAAGKYPLMAGELESTPQKLLELNTAKPYRKKYYPYESGTFKWYLKQYIDGAREKGAVPILVTPVARMVFTDSGTIQPHHGENDAYVTAVLQLAQEMKVDYIDLFAKTKALYKQIGERAAEKLHDIKADGTVDKTHYNKYGAFYIAGIVASAIQEKGFNLVKMIIPPAIKIDSTENLKKATLYVVGDSTACTYGEDPNYQVPRAGWGMFIGDCLSDRIMVNNLALSGRSSKSFTTESNYQTLLTGFQTGDYLIIQFGHNDAKAGTHEDKRLRYTDPRGDKDTEGSFKYYLYHFYIQPAQSKGVVPILATPVSRRKFDTTGDIQDTHGLYDDAVRELAAELQLAMIDLTAITANHYARLGPEKTASLHAVYKDPTKGEGGLDNTHYNHYGAGLVAQWTARALNDTPATLKNYILPHVLIESTP